MNIIYICHTNYKDGFYYAILNETIKKNSLNYF